MISIAAERARARSISNVCFEVTDAGTGQFPGGPFDAAVCRWALMFLADLPTALAGIRAALVPGGRLAASVVGPPDRYPLVTTVVGAICTALELPPPPPPPPPGEPGFFSLSDPDRLRGALAGAGFAEVSVELFDIAYQFDTGEQPADWQFAISAPVNALLAIRPERRAQARQAVADAAGHYRHPDGTICFPPSQNFYAVGRNPG